VVSPDQKESTEVMFADLRTPPESVHPPTAEALELLAAYRRSGKFQAK
jgi:hypothetical protein